jgi:hypothetical protein
MKALARDTSPKTQEVLFEMLRSAPAGKKLFLTFELIHTTRLLMLSGLRRRFPHATESQFRRRLISKLLPREDVMRAYGFDPTTQQE